MILTITGRPASGKSSLMRNIVAARFGCAEPLESVTTRSPRESDVPGEYKYVPQSWFDNFLQGGVFAWHDEVHGNRYGTRRKTLEHALESRNLHVALLTFKGVRDLLEFAIRGGKRASVRSIYLLVEDEGMLQSRMTQRGDTPDQIEKRILESRPWNDQARSMDVPFRFIDGTLPKEEVLKQALAFLDESA